MSMYEIPVGKVTTNGGASTTREHASRATRWYTRDPDDPIDGVYDSSPGQTGGVSEDPTAMIGRWFTAADNALTPATSLQVSADRFADDDSEPVNDKNIDGGLSGETSGDLDGGFVDSVFLDVVDSGEV